MRTNYYRFLCARRPQDSAEADPDMLPQALLRKYLTYAKQNCRPQLQQADYDKIQRVSVRDMKQHTHMHASHVCGIVKHIVVQFHVADL